MNSSTKYPLVQLAEVLTQDQSYITELEARAYPKLSVKLYSRGVTLDAPADGNAVRMTRHQLAKAGQVILSEIWAKKGAIGIVPPAGAGALVTSHFFLFDILEQKLSPLYMKWLLQANYFARHLDSEARGTTGYAAIRPKQFLALAVPLPPLPEQQRIVARIEALAGKIEAARGLREEAGRETQLLLGNSIDVVFQRANYPSVPLRKLTAKIGSGSTPRGGESVYVDEGVPLIRSLNVRMRKFQWDGIAYIDDDTHQRMAGTQVRPNDVLLNITGASIGRTSCAPNVPEANVTQHVMIIRPTDRLISRYLMYWLSRPTMQRSIDDQQKGATRQAITKSQVERLEIPLPPLEEQLRVVAELEGLQNQIDTLQREQEQTKLELDALLPAVLDRAFKGEL